MQTKSADIIDSEGTNPVVKRDIEEEIFINVYQLSSVRKIYAGEVIAKMLKEYIERGRSRKQNMARPDIVYNRASL